MCKRRNYFQYIFGSLCVLNLKTWENIPKDIIPYIRTWWQKYYKENGSGHDVVKCRGTISLPRIILFELYYYIDYIFSSSVNTLNHKVGKGTNTKHLLPQIIKILLIHHNYYIYWSTDSKVACLNTLCLHWRNVAFLECHLSHQWETWQGKLSQESCYKTLPGNDSVT